MRVKKIFPVEWLEMKPYNNSDSVDLYYVGLANKIMSLLEYNNEEVKQENSNKNPIVASVQRDYMAGEVSKDISRRLILPKDVVKAHDEGTIHFHDMDYFAQRIHNCVCDSSLAINYNIISPVVSNPCARSG